MTPLKNGLLTQTVFSSGCHSDRLPLRLLSGAFFDGLFSTLISKAIVTINTIRNKSIEPKRSTSILKKDWISRSFSDPTCLSKNQWLLQSSRKLWWFRHFSKTDNERIVLVVAFSYYSSPSTRLKTFSTGSLKICAMVMAMITEGVYSPPLQETDGLARDPLPSLASSDWLRPSRALSSFNRFF